MPYRRGPYRRGRYPRGVSHITHAEEANVRNFDSLSEREILALAISLEEEDERVYADFAEGLRQDFPASAAVFDGMRAEESGHRQRLMDLYREKFGDHIDRKSTRLNSSHLVISYAVFCLKKKKKQYNNHHDDLTNTKDSRTLT